MATVRVLVADDDRINLRILRALLEEDGYEPFLVESGDAAIQAIEADPSFDLVLLDVVMTGMDGISVCRHLKEKPKTAHIPVILMSAIRQDDSSIQAGLEAGAEGYLLKPVEDIALRAWVRATLRINALQRELTQSRGNHAPSPEEVLKTFAKLSHAVNNPLQAIYASVDMLTLSLPENAEVDKLSTEIFEHAETIANLVAQASLHAKGLLAKPPSEQAG
ncbi:MAG: response regulator [Nitrospiraceae bacterium]|nr:response regulator [Nitrospiraceae bacterium]